MRKNKYKYRNDCEKKDVKLDLNKDCNEFNNESKIKRNFIDTGLSVLVMFLLLGSLIFLFWYSAHNHLNSQNDLIEVAHVYETEILDRFVSNNGEYSKTKLTVNIEGKEVNINGSYYKATPKLIGQKIKVIAVKSYDNETKEFVDKPIIYASLDKGFDVPYFEYMYLPDGTYLDRNGETIEDLKLKIPNN